MAFKFKKYPYGKSKIPLPSIPSYSAGAEEEMLSGEINGMQASAGEERLARALDQAGLQYLFRYTVGAPRGLPGWKELDFLIFTNVIFALEVDTAFTHRSKENADKLHDAIVLNDRNIKAMGTLWPEVLHADGDSDLSSKQNARAYVRGTFGK